MVNRTKTSIRYLITILEQISIDYTVEAVAQQQIAELLDMFCIEFVREYRLTDTQIIDFYFPNSKIGLEVKAKKDMSKTAVYRQCQKYLENDQLVGLLLATGKAQGLPETINNKPVSVYQLGRGQL